MKAAIAAHTGAIASLEVVAVKTQVVAGLNIKARVKVNGDKVYTVVVHRPLPHTGGHPEVKSVEAGDHL